MATSSTTGEETDILTDKIAIQPSPSSRPVWSPVTRAAFRFAFTYFLLYCLTTQTLNSFVSIPNVDFPDPSSFPPLRLTIEWLATHLFHASQPVVVVGSGSGDKTYDYIQCLLLLSLSAMSTVLWTVLDRRRTSYVVLHKWFRLILRFALAGQWTTYGLVKLFPMQMSFPSLRTLLEPYGDFSPMGVLWSSIGASPSYERLCGSAELVAAILLFIPRTALLGSLISAAVAANIFALNMTYDVPVKLFSFELLVISLILIGPELSRLLTLFFSDRPVRPSTQPSLFNSARGNGIAIVVQLVFAAWVMGGSLYAICTQWPVWGAASPRSSLYGIWNVERFSIDHTERSPLLGDYGRWRRVLLDSPDRFGFQRMDDSFSGYDCTVDAKNSTMALTDSDNKKWKATLHYQRPAPDRLLLDGLIDGHPISMRLKQYKRNDFTLVNRGFHWIQEYPFNR